MKKDLLPAVGTDETQQGVARAIQATIHVRIRAPAQKKAKFVKGFLF